MSGWSGYFRTDPNSLTLLDRNIDYVGGDCGRGVRDIGGSNTGELPRQEVHLVEPGKLSLRGYIADKSTGFTRCLPIPPPAGALQ